MVKKLNLVGLIVAIVIIGLSCYIFSYGQSLRLPDTDEISLEAIEAPTTEEDKYYGGDAYTGIQQAAAQTANNLVSVFNALEQNSEAIATLNENNVEIGEATTYNTIALLSRITYCAGFILLAMGLTILAKSITLEIVFEKKTKQPTCAAYEVPGDQ